MRKLKKSQFLAGLYTVALGARSSLDRRLVCNPKEDTDYLDNYFTFRKLAEHELVEKGHGWLQGEGYTKKCPIAKAVKFLTYLKGREDMVSMKEVASNAMLLLEYTEAAWEEYQVLLANYEEVKKGLLAGLHAIAAENARRDGLL